MLKYKSFLKLINLLIVIYDNESRVNLLLWLLLLMDAANRGTKIRNGKVKGK